ELGERRRPQALLLAHVLRERRGVGEPRRVLRRRLPRCLGAPRLRPQELAHATASLARPAPRRHRATSDGRMSTASARLTRASAAAAPASALTRRTASCACAGG